LAEQAEPGEKKSRSLRPLGRLTPYVARYRGLVAGKRVAIIAARSGDYTPGSGNTRPDFQQPFLEAWLRFIGIADIATVAVQPTVASLEKVAAASEAAREQAIAIARAF